MKYVDYDLINSYGADVNIIYGNRSSGKTYGFQKMALERHAKDGSTFAMMRTIDEYIRAGRNRRYIAGIKPWCDNTLYNGEKSLDYWGGEFYLRSPSESSKKMDREIVGYALSLSSWLKYKSNNYESVSLVCMEEFLERRPSLRAVDYIEGYLNNLSTIIRRREGVRVFALGNTVLRSSPLFDYYGVKVNHVEQGRPVLFRAANGLMILVYWTPELGSDSEANRHYTVSDNSTAVMITRGGWETGDYPVAPLGDLLAHAVGWRSYRYGARIRVGDVIVCVPTKRTLPTLFIPIVGGLKVTTAVTLDALVYTLPHVYGRVLGDIRTRMILTDGTVGDGIAALEHFKPSLR